MTNAQVEEFQQIYKQEFGKELSYDDALEAAVKVVEMVRQVYKPIKKEDYEEFIKANKN